MSWIDAEVAFEVGKINRQVVGRAKRGAVLLRNSAAQVLGQDGTGRVYGRHRASAPGQPPAPDTGNLRRNWREESFVQSNGLGRGLDVKLRIRSDVPYAKYLEFGTHKMSPRPYVERIRSKARPEIESLFGGI